MKILAIVFALLALSYAHDDDEDHNDYNSLCETGYPSPFGNGWFYLGDMTSEKGYLSAFDNATGRTYYWNICGYDDNDDLEEICGDDNAVCYSQQGDVSQTYYPAGSFESLSAEAIETNDTVLLLLMYQNGAYCAASGNNAATSFALVCDENATTPVVDSVTYSTDGCDALLTIRTSAACIRDTLPSGCQKFWNRQHLLHIALWTFVGLFSFCCCCAFCAAIRRRRRCNRQRSCQLPSYQYTELQTSADKSEPIPQPVAQPIPQPSVAPQLTQMGGQYFMNINGVQFPVQLVPAPQYMQQQPAPVPLVPLAQEEEVVDLQAAQVEEDEKFARQLQAQLNQ